MSPLKNRMPKKFTIANFGHPVSESWLRPFPHKSNLYIFTKSTAELIFLWFQVYNEQIRDLLVPSGFLPIREDPQRGVVVNRLSLHKPHSAEELMHMLEFGNRNRTQHPTDANQESSRSHAVFQVSCASDFYFDVSGCTKQ